MSLTASSAAPEYPLYRSPQNEYGGQGFSHRARQKMVVFELSPDMTSLDMTLASFESQ